MSVKRIKNYIFVFIIKKYFWIIKMKNFLYKFELTSGLYSSYFYQQVKATDEKSAIVEIVSYLKNIEKKEAEIFIQESLWNINNDYNERNNKTEICKKLNWTIDEFWQKMDTKFLSSADQQCFYLINLKEINFDLENL